MLWDMAALSEKKSVIEAVTFDLWETLLFEEDGSDSERTAVRCSSLAQTLNEFGLKVTVIEAEVALRKAVSSLVEVWEKNRDVSLLDQIQLFLRYVPKGKLFVKREWFDKLSIAYVKPLFEVPPYLNSDAHELLEWLKDQRKHVGMICNTGLTPGVELRKFLSEVGIAEYFDMMLFSNEVGIRKPDRRIFRLAAQTLMIDPTKIVHIGDNLRIDVWGAKTAGFKAIHLSGNAGRDKIADSDPTSLVSVSRNLGVSGLKQLEPDRTIMSLSMVKEAIRGL